MLDLITQNKERIAELCRQHHVRQLSVFGSAARVTDFDPERSDVDFLVDFDLLPADIRVVSNLFALKDALGALLARSVDLVQDGSIRNPFVLKTIEEDRELLYAA